MEMEDYNETEDDEKLLDKKDMAAKIMEKLLEMYYSN